MPKTLSRIPANLPCLEVVSDSELLDLLDLAYYSWGHSPWCIPEQRGQPLSLFARQGFDVQLSTVLLLSEMDIRLWELWNQTKRGAAKSIASHNSFLNLQGRGGREGKKDPTQDIPCLIIVHTSTAIETLWFPCLRFSCNIPFVASRYVKSPWYSGSFKDLHFVFPCSFSDDVHKTEL